MKVFDLKEMKSNEDKSGNVIHNTQEFKIRMIELAPDGSIPPCEMAANVIFFVAEGKAEVTVKGEAVSLSEGQGIVSDPATISMKSSTGARLLCVQIMTAERKSANE